MLKSTVLLLSVIVLSACGEISSKIEPIPASPKAGTGTGVDVNAGKDGQNGKDGANGSSCSISKVGNIATVTCTDGTKADIYDGINGKDGSQGTPGINGIAGQKGEAGLNGKDGMDGKDGQNGKDGANGSSCSVTKNNNVVTITCADGSTVSINEPTVASNQPIVKIETLKAKRSYQKGTHIAAPVSVGKDSTVTLPDSIQVNYGNAGNNKARICVNDICCTYKGGSSVKSPLNPEESDHSHRSAAREDLLEVEKGRQYKLASCIGGSKTIQATKDSFVSLTIDSGDQSMDTEVSATVELTSSTP